MILPRQLQHWLVLAIKRLLFGMRGEPYALGEQTLYYLPGTRPVRLKYRDSSDIVARNDALQVSLILEQIGEGDRAVDVGAHAGQYGLLLAARSGPTGRVVSFEPDPDAAATYRKNIALNPGLRPPELVTLACSDRTGTATFFTQGGNAQSSLARSALPPSQSTNAINIQTVRLDEWWFRSETKAPKFVKIDTEGAEIHVLRGMPRILDSDALIVCELHPYAWSEFGVDFENLTEITHAHGRTLKWLDDGRGKVEPPGEYGTVLLTR